ncbi:hypothetical protein E6C27_scaffold89G002780 [Cucumis melo var. makuwa]|uniref:Uncharacterized protein n=1 Tax=Cucumis melo var. makuwa TaxID=1194695 RepID=A0A5A7V315_CUCMM|nr:hypothetical protein E6C27_scaffold89G002780 [Cucumis melo var. makuwa]
MSFERGNTKGRLISTSSKGNRSSSSSNYAPSPMNANQYAMDLGFATVSRSRSRSKSSTPPRPSASLICPSCRVVQMRPHVSPSSNKESSTPSPTTYSQVVTPEKWFVPKPKIKSYFQKSMILS